MRQNRLWREPLMMWSRELRVAVELGRKLGGRHDFFLFASPLSGVSCRKTTLGRCSQSPKCYVERRAVTTTMTAKPRRPATRCFSAVEMQGLLFILLYDRKNRTIELKEREGHTPPGRCCCCVVVGTLTRRQNPSDTRTLIIYLEVKSLTQPPRKQPTMVLAACSSPIE